MTYKLKKMKTIKYISTIVLCAFFMVACRNNAHPEVKTVETAEASTAEKNLDPNAHYAKAEFGIEGMTCAIGCAKTIEKKIAKMDGVKSATVDFDRKLAMVEYDDAKVTPKSLEEAVAMVSDTYKVNDIKTVDHFSNEAHECSEACKEACANKTGAEKMACGENCTKACCADHKK